ncbi:alpha/beta fold hydrolase [Dactylosporangium aurantiacum]|uniref:Alpha/beta fold hydrolase n=1 Tax=Dactylosporangium aurantiacum TaxID=35754 RepID=A0A9Q9IGK2_9ACTN|nr:alpha/beta fold hydrolase [Dactylosporangium aurantiacum]MDG6102758.1 alpha/beta fold hydrolase [Dactylosporangium aurantiacum]UWZ52999.1 alpha/beta fold hydrolase [Dactylosporangium aurantiacum]
MTSAGSSIHSVRRGAGEPLVLIHGIGHHWRAWEPVIDLLAEHHDVIAIDLPGFGRSPAPAQNHGMPSAVEALAGWFAETGLDRPHVAGNSLGGAIALELAAAGHARSVTALSPAGFCTPAQVRRALGILRGHRVGAFTPTPVLKAFYRTGFGKAFSFGWLVRDPGVLTAERALADTLALRGGKGFSAVARHGRAYTYTGRPDGVPVTIAWGSRDRIFLPVQADVARERLPWATHVALEGCGHVPMSDDPAGVAAVILRTTATAAATTAADSAHDDEPAQR